MNAKLLPLMVLGWAVVGCSGSDGATSPSQSANVVESAVSTAPGASTTDPAAVAVADLFLPDPAVGLDALTSYHQELVLTSVTTSSDSAFDFSNTFVSDVWPGSAAFTRLHCR